MGEQTSFLLVSAESSFVTIVVSLMLLGGMCCLVKFGRRFLSQQWSDKMPLTVSLGFQKGIG